LLKNLSNLFQKALFLLDVLVLEIKFLIRKVLPFLQKWNKIFVLSCLIAVSIDPLFFYVPVIDDGKKCLSRDKKMETTATVLRSFSDRHFLCYSYNFSISYVLDLLLPLLEYLEEVCWFKMLGLKYGFKFENNCGFILSTTLNFIFPHH